MLMRKVACKAVTKPSVNIEIFLATVTFCTQQSKHKDWAEFIVKHNVDTLVWTDCRHSLACTC